MASGYEIHHAGTNLSVLWYRLSGMLLTRAVQMSGYEVCTKIRETYSRTALPIIMVSAKSAPRN
eukprot:748321-Rhodomonas_salina.1